jgi:di/tricarboxylate transporter
LAIALAGAAYLFFLSGPLIAKSDREGAVDAEALHSHAPDVHHAQLGSPDLFSEGHALVPWKAALSVTVFAAVIALAAFSVAPIAAAAFAGAVLLIILRVITADQAYQGLRPEILMLIAGMVVLGIALEETGLAGDATRTLVGSLDGLQPLWALILLYGATLLLTELLSNATVAVLVTPMAVALAEALGVSPRPFIVAVMMAGSAAFATPFGYQTNVLVYQIGGYSYMDFIRVGLPLNLVTWATAVIAIPYFFPF